MNDRERAEYEAFINVADFISILERGTVRLRVILNFLYPYGRRTRRTLLASLVRGSGP